MRVCYIDASLHWNGGHWANACRHITGEFRRRGFVCDAFGHRRLGSSMAKEMGVTPLCRNEPYEPVASFHDALSYLLGRASFLHDLRSAWRHGPYDLVYINSALPPELAATALWLGDFRSGQTPPVAIEFGEPSGTDLLSESKKYKRFTRRTAFFKRAIKSIPPDITDRLLLFTFNAAASREYTELLGRSVATLPPVHAGIRLPRRRVRRPDGALTVAFLGGQRLEKGYQHVPEIARILWQRNLPMTVLAHNGDPFADTDIDEELSAWAVTEPRLTYLHCTADQIRWQGLLDRTDLLVLPYDPQRYRTSYSAVACEAVSEGIPMVVPERTTLEAMAKTYQGTPVSFPGWNPNAIADAVARAISMFEDLSEKAEAGAHAWRKENGAAPFVDNLLARLNLNGPVSTVRTASGLSQSMTAAGLDALFASRDFARALLGVFVPPRQTRLSADNSG